MKKKLWAGGAAMAVASGLMLSAAGPAAADMTPPETYTAVDEDFEAENSTPRSGSSFSGPGFSGSSTTGSGGSFDTGSGEDGTGSSVEGFTARFLRGLITGS
ncbi:hypothetical protein [Nocardia sp. NPDC050435]|uniref:hypothetical protein n=1 Tax=Nocardia sp. NPDC050435 TaxID=3155040 RepID=UPI0033D4FAB4